MRRETRTLSEDENYIYSETIDLDEPSAKAIPGIQWKGSCWFLKPMKDILSSFGISLESKQIQDLEDIVDGDINALQYISYLDNESVKWFMGSIMAESKSSNKHFLKILPPYLLAEFGNYVSNGKIPRPFAKEIFAILIEDGNIFINDVTFEEYEKYRYYDLGYLYGISTIMKSSAHILDDILKNPKYVLSSNIELDVIVDKVISINSDQFIKLKEDPKLLNWFVGQCMKEGKGKLSPQTVKDKLNERIST